MTIGSTCVNAQADLTEKRIVLNSDKYPRKSAELTQWMSILEGIFKISTNRGGKKKTKQREENNLLYYSQGYWELKKRRKFALRCHLHFKLQYIGYVITQYKAKEIPQSPGSSVWQCQMWAEKDTPLGTLREDSSQSWYLQLWECSTTMKHKAVSVQKPHDPGVSITNLTSSSKVK